MQIRSCSILTSLSLVASLLKHAHAADGPGRLSRLVTFGDSYTDIVSVGDGGTAWPVYAVGYANATLFPFAKSGAVCSQDLTPRPFPGVVQDELPAYLAQSQTGSIAVPSNETLYTLWIGTNDLGPTTLLLGQAIVNNATIVDVMECAVNWVKTLYDSGARNFLFQNLVPLDHVILYQANSYPNRFWTDIRNTTEWNLFMSELVAGGNAISRLLLRALASTLPGAHVGLFDSHALFTDILNNPAEYLNGTAPFNTTGCVNSCIFPLGNGSAAPVCTVAKGSDRDSFVWFDELHPSEQADRVVAREIANILEGIGSKWATWFS
ncbi:GDSL lipase/acylhydrolase [Vararia minispora EC-137]|uniref:GDSL lipase/acylhydrolase n=1 Tax=Vararia minispora EC-137 TaxID=1314806 RepID=A0ACB8QXK3_9AGAM|nr:GDSL lipase/acylhydrolase [Vararia minispora EC-137]